MDSKLFGLLLLAIICVSYMEAEASVCETRSKEFRGLCFRNDNCLSICEKEGFLSGTCKGLLLRCICAKSCVPGAAGGTSSGTAGGDGGTDGAGGDEGAPPDGGADGSSGGSDGSTSPTWSSVE